ncbi:MAG: glycosyltransferase family 2 protein [Bacteroidetes bacterium]|nr:glycosyltransferase family 2 protein [Bacteroidota bacterium]
MQPQLSVIIVNYNVRELLKNCIRSIYESIKNEDVEIIVVDNASSDGSEDFIRSVYPSVKWIANTSNAGFSEANNQGMEICNADCILLLNPDTEVKEGALQMLMNRLKVSGNLDVVAPRLLNSDLTLQPSAWKLPGVFSIFLETFYLHQLFRLNSYATADYQKDFNPEAASGAALAFRKTVYRSIGGLDPDLFWMDDTDFCYRIKKAGGRIHYVSGATIVHHSGKSSSKNLHVVIANQLLSKVKYMKKHSIWLTAGITSILIFLHILSRLFVFTLLSIIIPSQSVKRNAYFFSLKKFWNYQFFGESTIR